MKLESALAAAHRSNMVRQTTWITAVLSIGSAPIARHPVKKVMMKCLTECTITFGMQKAMTACMNQP